MKKLQFPLLRGMLALLVALAVLAGSVRAALAGNGAETWQNEPVSFEIYGSCSDPDGIYLLTGVSSGTYRYVEDKDGFKLLWNDQGKYSIEPIAADSAVTYSGKYVINFQIHLGRGSDTKTVVNQFVAEGSDGTRDVLHVTYHFVRTPDGFEREVDNVKWHCK